MSQFRRIYVAEKGCMGNQCLVCERIVFGHNDMTTHMCPTVDEEEGHHEEEQTDNATITEEAGSGRTGGKSSDDTDRRLGRDDDTSEWYRDTGTSGAG